MSAEDDHFVDYVMTIVGPHDVEAVWEFLENDGVIERLEKVVGTDVHMASQGANFEDNETFHAVVQQRNSYREAFTILTGNRLPMDHADVVTIQKRAQQALDLYTEQKMGFVFGTPEVRGMVDAILESLLGIEPRHLPKINPETPVEGER